MLFVVSLPTRQKPSKPQFPPRRSDAIPVTNDASQMEARAGNLLVGLTKGSSLVCLKYKFPVRELNCDNSGTMLRNVGPGEGSG